MNNWIQRSSSCIWKHQRIINSCELNKITVFFLVLLSASVFSQNKKVVFTKEFRYSFQDDKNKNIQIGIFGNTSNELLINSKVDQFPFNVFMDDLGSSFVSFGMNNQLENSMYSQFFTGMMHNSPLQTKKDLIIQKTDEKETILGMPCQYYHINLKDANQDEALKVCVNESYPVNTFSALNGIMNIFTNNKNKSGLRGLILKGGPSGEKFEKEFFVLNEIKDTDAYVYFDHKGSMMKHQRKMDSLMLEQQRWNEDFANDSLSVFSDSTAVYNNYSYIPEYVSTYKKENKEMATLAIDNPFSKELLIGAPRYCTNIEKDFPVFENKRIAKHLKNYVGQVCDMYLTQSDSETVDEKGTIDEIRREVLFLLNIRDDLSKSDKKKLDKYLDQLD